MEPRTTVLEGSGWIHLGTLVAFGTSVYLGNSRGFHLAQLNTSSLSAEHASMAQMGPSDPAQRAVIICGVVRQHGGDGPAWPNLTRSRYLQSMPAWRRWVHPTQLDEQSLFAG